jgi:hypothetical protein
MVIMAPLLFTAGVPPISLLFRGLAGLLYDDDDGDW